MASGCCMGSSVTEDSSVSAEEDSEDSDDEVDSAEDVLSEVSFASLFEQLQKSAVTMQRIRTKQSKRFINANFVSVFIF